MPALSSDPLPGGTFVSVGNRTEPFHRLLAAVRAGAESDCLPRPVTVQCGHTPFALDGANVVPFVDMDTFLGHVAAARLLVLHGGAGSLISALRAGKVPVVMAREYAYGEVLDNHQLELVRAFDALQRIELLMSSAGICTAVASALRRQDVGGARPTGPSKLVEYVRADLLRVSLALPRT